MEVEYELTPDDLYAFQWRAAFDSSLGRRTARKVYLGWFLAQHFLGRWLMRRAILHLLRKEKPGRGQLGRHKVVLAEGDVVETTAVGESRTAWAGVDRVEQNPQYIFIYTSPAAAHLIPKRAFRDIQEAEDFYQLSQTRKEAAT